jgi:hypothetical protein
MNEGGVTIGAMGRRLADSKLLFELRPFEGKGLIRRCRLAFSALEAPGRLNRVTESGTETASSGSVLFHKRVCGPLANTLFHHRPTNTPTPPAKIEAAYHKADVAIQRLIGLLAA